MSASEHTITFNVFKSEKHTKRTLYLTRRNVTSKKGHSVSWTYPANDIHSVTRLPKYVSALYCCFMGTLFPTYQREAFLHQRAHTLRIRSRGRKSGGLSLLHPI